MRLEYQFLLGSSVLGILVGCFFSLPLLLGVSGVVALLSLCWYFSKPAHGGFCPISERDGAFMILLFTVIPFLGAAWFVAAIRLLG